MTGGYGKGPDIINSCTVSVNKAERVSNFHSETLKSFVELTAAAGLYEPSQVRREHINRRVSMNRAMKYSEIFPYIGKGSLRDPKFLDVYLREDL